MRCFYQFKAFLRVGSLVLVALVAITAGAADAAAWTTKVFKLMPPASGGTDPGSSGSILVRNNPMGPDRAVATFTGLAKKSCYTVFLTNTPVSGSTPGSLLGQFCTNGAGRGRFVVRTEIVDSFLFTNFKLDPDMDGSVSGQGAGVIANGGIVIATPVIRVYRANPGSGPPTVFGASPGVPGGLHTLSSPTIN
jgi:hypothetical protein